MAWEALVRVAAVAALALLGAGGCFPGYIYVGLKTAPGTNRGTPLYLVVRTVDPKMPAPPAYSEVVGLLQAPDASVVRSMLLYPGRRYNFHLKSPAKGSLGLYFLFTDPGGSWNVVLTQPMPWWVKASLQGNIVAQESAR